MKPKSRAPVWKAIPVLNALATFAVCALLFVRYPPVSSKPGQTQKPLPPTPEPTAVPQAETAQDGIEWPRTLTMSYFERQIDPGNITGPVKASVPASQNSYPLYTHTPESVGRDAAYPWSLSQTPSNITAVKPAMDGRLLVIQTEEAPFLYVYDVIRGKLSGALPLPSSTFLFAAGGNRAVVYLPGLNLLQSFCLDEMRLLESKVNTMGPALYELVMGTDNADIAACYVQDPESREHSVFRLLEVPALTEQKNVSLVKKEKEQYASIYRLQNKQQSVSMSANSVMTVLSASPRYENEVVYFQRIGSECRSIGVFEYRGRKRPPVITQRDLHHRLIDLPGAEAGEHGAWMFPIHGTGLFFRLREVRQQTGLDLFSADHTSVLGSVDPLPLAHDEKEKQFNVRNFPPSIRYFYHPDSDSFIYVSSDRRSILRTSLPLNRILSPKEHSLPVVTSAPILQTEIGRAFSHQIKTAPTQQEISYSLTLAPEGMSISARGLLEWEVPVQPTGNPLEIAVQLSLPGSRPVLHRIDLYIPNLLKP